ncbi:MAG: cytochrome c [Deltaproteobacteria bacterium]|nr:cytochrome c [Deltaproteobacteria bacterium]
MQLRWALLLAMTACAAGGAKATSPEQYRSMPAPVHLSAEARDALGTRMQGHGDDMNDLLWSILFLDFESTSDIALHIATETPPPSAHVPPDIIGYETRLNALSAELRAAAKAEDAARVAELYGKIAETCVRCHASYLTEPPLPPSEGAAEGGPPG